MAKADKSKAGKASKISDDVIEGEIIEVTQPDGEDGTSDAPLKDAVSDDMLEEAVEPDTGDEAETEAAQDDGETASDAPEDEPETPDDASEPDAVVADEADAVQETQTDPVPAQIIAEAPRRRGVFIPLVLGGIVAAGIGYGMAQYVMPQGWPLSIGTTQGEEAENFQAETVATLKAQQDAIAGLKADLASAGDQSETTSALADLNTDLAAIRQDLTALQQTVGGFDARIAELEKRPVSEAVSPAAIEAYEREVKALQEAVAAQVAEAEEMEQNAQMTAREALARSAITRVVSALDSGAPFRAALTDLQSATGLNVPTALSDHADDGLPTMISLMDSFPEPARMALAAARREGSEDTTGNKFATFLKNQLGARSVAPKEGGDTDAILSRSEAALREGRLSDALAELATLPPVAAEQLAGWTATAQQRNDAVQAADALAQSLNTQ